MRLSHRLLKQHMAATFSCVLADMEHPGAEQQIHHRCRQFLAIDRPDQSRQIDVSHLCAGTAMRMHQAQIPCRFPYSKGRFEKRPRVQIGSIPIGTPQPVQTSGCGTDQGLHGKADFIGPAVLDSVAQGSMKQNPLDRGGLQFPAPVKAGMSLLSKVMTASTYRI